MSATADDVAAWMKAKLEYFHTLYQAEVAHEIRWTFGDEHTYINKNGNVAIESDVLDAFRERTEDDVMWEAGERYWRRKFDHEPDGQRKAN